jgi:hypothetical protein
MIRYAAKWGWEVDVVTRAPGALDAKSLLRLQTLPAGCRVYGAQEPPTLLERMEQFMGAVRRKLKGSPVHAAEPSSAVPAAQEVQSTAGRTLRKEEVLALGFSVRQILRAYFAWREFVIQRPWCRNATRIGGELARQTSYDALITCGPPHLIHAAAVDLSRKTGLPLILDLRDPWSLQEILPNIRASRLWYRLAGHYEARAVRAAAVVALNTEPCCAAMRSRYPDRAERMLTVTNGYDEREVMPPSQRDGRFVITYAGSLYFVYEHPRPFFQGVGALVRELGLTPAQLGLEFVGHSGNYEGESMEAIAASAGLAGFFHCSPHQPRRDILPRLAQATVLVSLAQLNDFAIPSKIFDYLRFDAWLLAIAKPGTATDILLRGTDADLVPTNDPALIHAALRRRYLDFRQGIRPAALAPQTRSSRSEQASLFFEAVQAAVNARTRR